jgi:hypothetical protein
VSRFLRNKNFESEVEAQSEHRAGLREVAEGVKRGAEAAVRSIGGPWMPRKDHDVIEVGEDEDGVYVANTAHSGHLEEYGSQNNPPYAPLRQGAQSAGLRVDDE